MINRGFSETIKKYKKKPVIIEAMKYTEDNYKKLSLLLVKIIV